MKGNAIIAGAGIGGLAAGLALLRKGWQVRIYEQSDDIRILGAAIYIWENGLRVLETLGVYEQVTAGVQQVQVRERRGAQGELLGVENTAASGRLFLPMRRALLTSLKDAVLAAGGEIQFGKSIQSADPGGACASATVRWSTPISWSAPTASTAGYATASGCCARASRWGSTAIAS